MRIYQAVMDRVVRPILFLVIAIVILPCQIAVGDPADDVRSAFRDLDVWLQSSTFGPGWHDYLRSETLRGQLAGKESPDPEAIGSVLKRYESGTAGLDRDRFVRVRDALRDWQLLLVVAPMEQLPEVARSAQDTYKKPTDQRVAAAKAVVQRSADNLDSFLATGGSKGASWKEFLKWEALTGQLSRQQPDTAELDNVLKQYYEDYDGLELPQFLAVRSALRAYVDHLVAANDPRVEKRYQKLTSDLAELLGNYGSDSTHLDTLAIAARLGFLHRYGQADSLVRSVRHHYSHPNLQAYVTREIVAAGIEDVVDEQTHIEDSILGTYIVGLGDTKGDIKVALNPDADRAAILLKMKGVTSASTTGYNRGVSIYSSSISQLEADKKIFFAQQGWWAEPTDAQASTSSNVNGLSASNRVGKRMIERIAWRKVAKQKGQAETVGSSRAAARLQQRMDEQAQEMLAKVNDRYLQDFRNPLLRRDAFPETFDVRTTANRIHLTLLEATGQQLAAPAAPPELPRQTDMAVSLHESVINNFAAALLGGRTYRNQNFAKRASEEVKGNSPNKDLVVFMANANFLRARDQDADMLQKFKDRRNQRLKAHGQPVPEVDPEEQRKRQSALAMVFADYNPVSVEFRDGTLKFNLRVTRFVSHDNISGLLKVHSEPMNIWGIYDIKRDDIGGLRLTLKEWDVSPLKGSRSAGARMPLKTRLARQKLLARFGSILEGKNGENKVVDVFPLELPGKWSRLGELAYTVADSAGGWLSLGWNQKLDKQARLPVVDEKTVQ